jgi:hypothetical protein
MKQKHVKTTALAKAKAPSSTTATITKLQYSMQALFHMQNSADML